MTAVSGEPRGEGQVVQTLDRGLRILRHLADERDGLSAAALAERLGVHRAIVYRLLSTLAHHRLVVRGADGRHRLWTGLVELGRTVAPRLRSVAEPELVQLAEDAVATAFLSVASEDAAVALAVVEPSNAAFHVAYRPGLRHPLTVGAPGKAILMARPARDGEPPDVTEARVHGYIITRGELQSGAVGVAAPIVIDGWADAAIGVVVLGDLKESICPRVVTAAAAVARAFPGAKSASL